MRFIITIVLFSISAIALNAQEQRSFINQGNDFFKAGELDKAISSYDKVTDDEYKQTALLNKGAVLYHQKKYEEAVKVYRQVSQSPKASTEQQAAAFYNEGAVYSAQKKLSESIEAYKKALRLNSDDAQARENLQKALLAQKRTGGGGGSSQKPNSSSSKLNNSQVQQQLKRLEQKEKSTQDRVDGKKTQSRGSVGKDW